MWGNKEIEEDQRRDEGTLTADRSEFKKKKFYADPTERSRRFERFYTKNFEIPVLDPRFNKHDRYKL